MDIKRKALNLIDSEKYRKDIDGLRAIAVIPVILFHFGWLESGYLGVDIFFVISGFLITGIIYHKIQQDSFSITDFYVRRTRRILPLVSFICLISIIVGIFVMLPDDLENLAQSVIATNLFSNNILQILTTKNYWDVVNEFKPLMHTWSLAIEEQYYLLYPFIFLFLGKRRISWILPLLIALTLISIILFFTPFPEFEKFYLLHFRFFELSIGGIAAIILKRRTITHNWNWLVVLGLMFLLIFKIEAIPESFSLLLCIGLTTLILISSNQKERFSNFILTNKLAIFFGKISFSLYMWHQLILAFSRYFILKEINTVDYFFIFIVTIFLSFLSFKIIESPFRDKNIMQTRTVFLILFGLFFTTTATSGYIVFKSGVLRDVPELNILSDTVTKNQHSKYNDRIYKYDLPFKSKDKIKILVIGNSFSRDWANVLLESEIKENIEVSYIYDPYKSPEFETRKNEADLIFVSSFRKEKIESFELKDLNFHVIGAKNFGVNNGFFYNYTGKEFCLQTTKMEEGYLTSNVNQSLVWKERYINLINLFLNNNNEVPVFTDNCKFISQDTRHFTKDGAKFTAKLLDKQLKEFISDLK